MKKYNLLIIILFSVVTAFSQNISVKSFRPLPNDMTAASLEWKRKDQNGSAAALIKVVTSQTGFYFDGGTLGIVDTKQMVGEIWVWVPYGSRKITISHQQLGVLRDYRFPVEIEPERTYEMVLTTGSVETIIKEVAHEQYLMFQISPPDAVLEVNEQMWTVSPSGNASKLVNFGTYTYRVQAPNYHADAGTVTVNDPDNTQKVTIKLLPNFGWIEVPGGGLLQGATVYIDNAIIGKAPCKSGALKSGQHSVRVVKELYEPYSTVVTVADNETTTVNPNLSADFAKVTLQVDADAEIWVNNERKGTRSWTGNLPTGVYRIECKQVNHEPSLTTKEITNQMNGEVIPLQAPKPIYGSLLVESEPALATIFIDGQVSGQTPKLIKEILIGQHEIKLVKDDYRVYTETITIAKGERKQVNATMEDRKAEQLSKQCDDYFKAKNYQEALTCYQEAAELGDANGQLGLGILYYCGYGVAKDYAEALKWLELAQKQGNPKAMQYCAEVYVNGGLGVTRNQKKALELFTLSGDQGNGDAYRQLGYYYKFGASGFPKDEATSDRWYKKSVETYRKAAEQGDAEAQYSLAFCYCRGMGVKQSWSEAVKWYRLAAEQDHYHAKMQLGYCYFFGLGVTKNRAKAEQLFHEVDYADACNRIGQAYAYGIDTRKDLAKAAEWYRKAADMGNAEGQYELGGLYHYGEGVGQNAGEAEKWYLKAAEGNYSSAWFALGLLYYSGGVGVTKDYAKAMYWFKKDADYGGYISKYYIGKMYENGEGVAKDLKEAKKWYQLSADQGYDKAIQALEKIK
ncbi:MAG: SEL1-like repeat protein [Bacteroidales bacterium]|nr:SEL1-like repeat protein [Bacteroidales bacterium]